MAFAGCAAFERSAVAGLFGEAGIEDMQMAVAGVRRKIERQVRTAFFRRRIQRIAMALAGEPTPPRRFSGDETKK